MELSSVKGTKITDTVLLLEGGVCIPVKSNAYDCGSEGWWLLFRLPYQYQVLDFIRHF